MSRRRLQTILPPYLMDQLGLAEDPIIREAAQSTQLLDQTFRANRLEKKESRPAKNFPVIQIFDANHAQTLPGQLVRSARQAPVDDPAVNEAWDGLQATLKFLQNTFRRNSLDDDGTRLRASVHFGERYMNAFWDGRQMVFGDGDGILFRGFTAAVDVIGHELGHGIIADEGQLAYVYLSLIHISEPTRPY